ncbi:MAG: FmdB family zinc ribbon protein [Nocardioides sp.]
MPTYQYRCTDCGHELEEFQSFTDDALTVCPACGGRLRKMFNAVGVVFKGSGFYRTDSRQAGPAATGSSSDASPDASSSKSSSESAGAAAGSGATSSPAPAAPSTSGSSSG